MEKPLHPYKTFILIIGSWTKFNGSFGLSYDMDD